MVRSLAERVACYGVVGGGEGIEPGGYNLTTTTTTKTTIPYLTILHL